MPKIFDVADPEQRKEGIAAAVAALRSGLLVAVPTETVYGLAADAMRSEAVRAIFRAKSRPDFNPLIAHVGSMAEARKLGELSARAHAAASQFWPGPLTMVIRRRTGAGLCEEAMAGLDTVAVRLPAQPVARDLLAAFGGALVAPSANRSGHVSATTAGHVVADLADAVAVILDDGPSPVGIESTIVDFTGPPKLLRPGAVPQSALERVLGVELRQPAAVEQAIVAPGMLASHYAPAATVRLNAVSVQRGEALLKFGPWRGADTSGALAVASLSESGDLEEAAANLFAALRELDAVAGAIAVAPVPEGGLGAAINDRLRRAAAPRS